jgi:ABC-type transport system involved in cytochrome c biogenesis ATPase subunit
MLEAIGLQCVRQQRTLFNSLSFSLAAGERLRIAGVNGSGKTSLLRILCGLLAPSEGEVRWRGEKISSLEEEYSRQIVYLGHAAAVKDDLTPVENLEVACRLVGISSETKILEDALAQLGVPSDVPVRSSRRASGAGAHLAASSSASRFRSGCSTSPTQRLTHRRPPPSTLITAHAARRRGDLYHPSGDAPRRRG